MKLQVTSPLASTSQGCHNDHELRKACSIPTGQHVCCHGNQRAEEHGAYSFSNLAVVPHNVSCEELQKLSIFLHNFQVLGIFWWGGRHTGQPGLQTWWLHTSQLGQGATQRQQALVWTLLRWGWQVRLLLKCGLKTVPKIQHLSKPLCLN